MQRPVMISIGVALLSVISVTMIGCEKTDERLYGRWEASVEATFGGNNQGGNDDQDGNNGAGNRRRDFMNRMTPAERTAMEERLANRKMVFEFSDEGQWTCGIDWNAAAEIPPTGDTQTFLITSKDDNTATVDLLEYEFVMYTITIQYDETGGFTMDGFQGNGPQMKFGTFRKIAVAKTE
jgi:hypothetical protein